MRMKFRWMTPFFPLLLFFTIAAGFPTANMTGTERRILGEVNDARQIVTDEGIYDVVTTPIGNNLVYHYISAKVELVCTIIERDETKIIDVISFRVIENE